MRRILSVLLAAALLMALVPLGAMPVFATSVDDLTVSISGGQASITGCNTSAAGDLEIPSSFAGFPVTTISYRAFANCNNLTSITIPASVMYIDSEAFYATRNLTAIHVVADNVSYSSLDGVLYNHNQSTLVSYPNGRIGAFTIPDTVVTIGAKAFYWYSQVSAVTIPDSVRHIQNNAFYNCANLASVIFGNGVLTIGDSAFWKCEKLTELTLLDGVASIGASAFAYCLDIQTITLPDSVQSIGNSAFGNCNAIRNIYYGGSRKDRMAITIGTGNDSIRSDNRWHYTHKQKSGPVCNGFVYNIIGDEVTIIDYVGETITEANIPAFIDGYPVTKIGNNAFDSCYTLSSLTIPNTVKVIGEEAFYKCQKLTDVFIPEGVTTIGASAFYECNSDITLIPASVTYIGENAFYEYGECFGVLYTGTDEDWKKITIIGDINDSKLNYRTNVIVDNGVIYNLRDGSARAIASTNDVPSDLIIPSEINGYTVTEIGNSASKYWGDRERGAFEGRNITSVHIPDSVTHIRRAAFAGCPITSLVIPDSVVTIEGFFAYFSEPYSYIGAFAGCTKLETVIFGNGVTTIDHSLFAGCVSLKSLTIPDSVTKIEECAFGECPALTEFRVAENNTHFCAEDGVLFNKDKTVLIKYPGGKDATEYMVPDGVVTIASEAFYGCRLESVVIPDSVESLACSMCFARECRGAFMLCKKLKSVTLGSGVKSVDYYAFDNCDSLTDVYYVGSETDRADISIESKALLNAAWHYNSCIHRYDMNCDSDCNLCGAVRVVTHYYDHACDFDCNLCGEIRVPASHVYDHVYDPDCNICGETRQVPDAIVGDTNKDGKVNVRDLGHLQQYLNGWGVEVLISTCDVNGDGKVNVRDLGHLQQYLNGWDVDLGSNTV